MQHDPVYLDTASVGKLILGSTQLKLDMKRKVERQLAEAAAVLEEEAAADENTWVLNKDLGERGRIIFTTAWDVPPSSEL